MTSQELSEKLNLLEPNLATIRSFFSQKNYAALITSLEQETLQDNFWKHPEQTTILKELQRLKNLQSEYKHLIATHEELHEMLSLFKDDEATLQQLAQDISILTKQISRFKLSILLDNKEDTSPCFLNINAGAGGTESQDWAAMLLRMYLRYVEKEKLKAEIIDYHSGEEAGIKSVTLFIKGRYPYGLFKSEHGVHRLVRISPFDASKRRHTSFAAVNVMPEAPDIEITIDSNDLRIDTYRAGGAGGQHVNKTESAIRIVHLPTNTVVQCQNERSQAQNKETAMKMLKAKFAQKSKEDYETKISSIEKKKIEWGSQIRSYVLHPYKMVKDHRTSIENSQPELVLDGDLTEFIEAFLVWEKQ